MIKLVLSLMVLYLFTGCTSIEPYIDESHLGVEEKIQYFEQVKEGGPLTLLIDDWPPYTVQGELKGGIATQIVVAALEAENLSYEVQFVPWSRSMEMVEFKEGWGTFPWYYIEERTEIYAYSDLILETPSSIYYNKANPKFAQGVPEFETLLDLKAFSFGGVNGYYYETLFEEENFNYTLSHSLEAAFKLLLEGKVDLINEDAFVGWYILETHYADQINLIENVMYDGVSEEMFLLVNKEMEEKYGFLKMFNRGLATIKENGTYHEILRNLRGE